MKPETVNALSAPRLRPAPSFANATVGEHVRVSRLSPLPPSAAPPPPRPSSQPESVGAIRSDIEPSAPSACGRTTAMSGIRIPACSKLNCVDARAGLCCQARPSPCNHPRTR